MSAILEHEREVNGVIKFLVSCIKEEIKLAWGFKEELEKLKERFEELSCILQKTSGQSVTNQVMAGWLKKIKDVAEDVNILLDECSYRALQDKIIRPQWYQKCCRRQVMAHKVNGMTKAVDRIYNLAHKLGINLVQAGGGEVNSDMHSHEIENQERNLQDRRNHVDYKSLLGREEHIKKIVESLRDATNSKSDLTVIGIVGMAGLGKTALVKHIFKKRQEVTNLFKSLVIWLVVSHDYNLTDMLNRMVEIIFKETSNFQDTHALISKLQERLKEKKYLLILDDVWDTVDWEPLLSTLQQIGGSQGTTLLVTSREKDVVEKMETRSSYGSEGNVTNGTLKSPTIHVLPGLSECDSWSLFKEKVGEKNLVGNEKIELAEKMLKRCGGVPLAIRALGKLLSNTIIQEGLSQKIIQEESRDTRIQEWKKIEESEIWTKKDENDILPSLRLSYNYLPNLALKKCFAYCAVYGEDVFIEKKKLIYQWMAQGFLQPYEEMELEGEKYIDHLFNSSFFQDAVLDKNDNVYKFKMHDLVRSLAGVVSKGECLSSYRDDEDLDKVRHLLVPHNSECRELTFASCKKLQTCMFNKDFQNPSLGISLKFKHLRVLVIGRSWSENTKWKPLGELIHLRYFEIDAKDLKHFKLPVQITKLYHLQTLCINNLLTDREEPRKTVFPEEICNLVKIRHIILADDIKIGIPVWLSQLTALQTLPVINLGLNWGGSISYMGLLTNLRGELEIHCLTLLTTVEEGQSLYLCRKSNLDSLVLKWGDDYERADKKIPEANEILKALKPHENLRKLRLQCFDGTAFPKWLMGPDSPLINIVGPDSPLINIVSLQILSCKEAHGNLKLENFICLRTLIVQFCGKLTVTFAKDRSQCCKFLEELKIVECDKVEGLPDLLLMPKLRDIQITNNKSTSRDGVLVGLGSLPHLRKLNTDLKLPADLGKDSLVCKSLEELKLNGSKKYNGDTTTDLSKKTTDLPEQLQHLVALRSLGIHGFIGVEAIPNWLGKFTSLESLRLTGMLKLKQLPPRDVMRSLSYLTLLDCSPGCPILEKDIKNRSGEWFKISHLPEIRPVTTCTPSYIQTGVEYSRTRSGNRVEPEIAEGASYMI